MDKETEKKIGGLSRGQIQTLAWELVRRCMAKKKDRRNPEYEEAIMMDPEATVEYARKVIGGRWPEAEPGILKDPLNAAAYAKEVVGGRWPELEKTSREAFLSLERTGELPPGSWGDAVCDYASNFRFLQSPGGRSVFEGILLKEAATDAPHLAFDYATTKRRRWPKAEEAVAKYISANPLTFSVSALRAILMYARTFGSVRLPLLESAVVDSGMVVEYALAIKSRIAREGWPEAESRILELARSFEFEPAVEYAGEVSRKRWPELEEAMLGVPPKLSRPCTDSLGVFDLIVRYAENVVKGPWPEMEDRMVDIIGMIPAANPDADPRALERLQASIAARLLQYVLRKKARVTPRLDKFVAKFVNDHNYSQRLTANLVLLSASYKDMLKQMLSGSVPKPEIKRERFQPLSEIVEQIAPGRLS